MANRLITTNTVFASLPSGIFGCPFFVPWRSASIRTQSAKKRQQGAEFVGSGPMQPFEYGHLGADDLDAVSPHALHACPMVIRRARGGGVGNQKYVESGRLQVDGALQHADMAFHADNDYLLPSRLAKQIDHTGFGGAGKMGFCEKNRAYRSIPDFWNRRSDAGHAVFGNIGRYAQLLCRSQQANAVADNPFAFRNCRCQFFLDVDNEQQRGFALDQHGSRSPWQAAKMKAGGSPGGALCAVQGGVVNYRKTTVLLPCTSTRSSRW